MEEIRLNKYLSEMGLCSRREADRLIESGKVMVDGARSYGHEDTGRSGSGLKWEAGGRDFWTKAGAFGGE